MTGRHEVAVEDACTHFRCTNLSVVWETGLAMCSERGSSTICLLSSDLPVVSSLLSLLLRRLQWQVRVAVMVVAKVA